MFFLQDSVIKLKKGNNANLTIINPTKEWILTHDNIYSKSMNTPFIGSKITGFIEGVVSEKHYFG